MSYFSDHYHSYVPPFILGTEKVKMSIMKVTNMTETEQRIKMRHAFAMSSFARMFTPNRLTSEMRSLCHEWSKIEEQPPTGDLYQVDRYFLELWKTWSLKSAL
ncbi:hypothetical protein Syn7803C76_106 [Synechococcus phage ACG-2014b]|uniref:Uncharacterized protein n=3 Tax=Synechococcus phage ACG-2014b TaxID=1493508 RepID=A0A0E3FRB1_9CAUD|nr:hypothetical protein ABF04_gp106 [Synechococcus phage ACG-2014b]YP_009779731.1 hypothetical protein HOQ67_gp103 [Synechococcus phage ACG-2014b]AIX17325.1 hypothetical protein Syn7803C61_103 [Synechococcus phage ACG-2014b]AIX17973.1 hypothetical protein Syn7803C68_105 [Synechococcus phage ACG-2014b]AIX19346.1 hypothetical protein Syn7803C76_106 [Synechococcus phage ACG-2014b]AIX19780.1 hypothetical protein Syn7803C78_105 [Synechococcus phage ACG-2014b]AIX22009.1 hypothetical protein Syn7803